MDGKYPALSLPAPVADIGNRLRPLRPWVLSEPHSPAAGSGQPPPRHWASKSSGPEMEPTAIPLEVFVLWSKDDF